MDAMAAEAAALQRMAARRAEWRRKAAKLDDIFEVPWRNRQPLLAARGYSLRPRFHPDWQPSWEQDEDAEPDDFEDSWKPWPFVNLIDATRDSDGRLVCLKRVPTGGSEMAIAKYFSTAPLADDPRNHCIPVLDSFQDQADPAYSYIVMPHFRAMNDPPFEIVDDILDFVEQVLEGIAFMHAHDVAHRDAAETNILMDATSLFPLGYHPTQQDRLPPPHSDMDAPVVPRSSVPGTVRYYLADFGMSTHFQPGVPRLVTGALGAEREVPELSETKPYDPFKLDIYVLGKVFKDQIYDKYRRTGFLWPLIAAMMQRNPKRRPTAQEALQQWRHVRTRTLLIQRSCRLHGRDESIVYAIIYDVLSFLKILYVLAKRLAGWSLGWLALLFV